MEPADGMAHHSNDHNLSDTSERTGLNIIAVEAIEAGRVEEKLRDVGETRFMAKCEPGTSCFRQIARGDVVIDLRPFVGR